MRDVLFVGLTGVVCASLFYPLNKVLRNIENLLSKRSRHLTDVNESLKSIHDVLKPKTTAKDMMAESLKLLVEEDKKDQGRELYEMWNNLFPEDKLA